MSGSTHKTPLTSPVDTARQTHLCGTNGTQTCETTCTEHGTNCTGSHHLLYLKEMKINVLSLIQ